MGKITRIAYNSADWHHPTGEAAQHEGGESYTNLNGFGHEDWLFRDEWQIDGWRYAFLQGVNRSYRKLVEERKPFDVTLYTIQPDKQRRYVARIEDVECLDDKQAATALDVFKANGWFSSMQEEVREIGGNIEALGNVQWARHALNVRYRLENVHRFARDTFASQDDPVWHLNRYSLTGVDGLREKFRRNGGRAGSADFPSIAEYTRHGVGPTRVSPEHARMQTVLMKQLRAEFPGTAVVREENFIDVMVKTNSELRLYEIKSDLSPRTVLRLAIGQLLEYSYFQIDSEGRKVTLVAVGRNQLSNDDAAYLAHLRDSVGLPLEYRVVTV
ncbi:hypothetical protein [Paraburkholderia sacchari]|uniref:Uncharacterized protein n=1 Tax=Paraburkholderia sacchari TaxID=159450 RepID=A0A8T6ZCT1_9BURK|nr:hypothetical protein [Paraburkholderia sacchari]NLP62100.1 hypothetical protein [Paraburkholderia sacchari]